MQSIKFLNSQIHLFVYLYATFVNFFLRVFFGSLVFSFVLIYMNLFLLSLFK